MLPDNGKYVKQRNNLHMTFHEFVTIIRHAKKNHHPKIVLLLYVQYGLGLRASEALAIQIQDFKENFRKLNYRQAKTNKMIYNEPVPDDVRLMILDYLEKNLHSLKNGYLFPGLRGGHMKMENYGGYFSKWRKQLGGDFLDKYDYKIWDCEVCNTRGRRKSWSDERMHKMGLNGECPMCGAQLVMRTVHQYHISSHSLRRLHRTTVGRAYKENLHLASQLCHYADVKTFEDYLNGFEIMAVREKYLLPVIDPVLGEITRLHKDQTSLKLKNWI